MHWMAVEDKIEIENKQLLSVLANCGVYVQNK